jgi:hypothetical protein
MVSIQRKVNKRRGLSVKNKIAKCKIANLHPHPSFTISLNCLSLYSFFAQNPFVGFFSTASYSLICSHTQPLSRSIGGAPYVRGKAVASPDCLCFGDNLSVTLLFLSTLVVRQQNNMYNCFP